MAKIDYKSKIIEYLKEYPNTELTRDDIIKSTGVSKSRLSEIINSIRSDGYNIVSPPRSGIIKLVSPEIDEILPTIKDADLRKWLIIFLLSKYEHLSFLELLLKMMSLKDYSLEQMKYLMDLDSDRQYYDDNHLIKNIRKNTSFSGDEELTYVAKDVISVTTLRKDLKELRDDGIISMNQSTHTTYQLTSAAPLMIPISGDSLFEFCQKYEDTSSSISDLEPLKQAYARISNLINFEKNNNLLHRFGKLNDISDKQIETFNEFVNHPYKTNILQFDTSFNGISTRDKFAVGLLFYSVETSAFYSLGMNITKGKIESRRLDWISKITTLEEKNAEFHSQKYYDIYNEMFSSSYEEESYKVKVLFSDFGNITKRFMDLQTLRPTASIRPILNSPTDCNYEYIYEDTIRGLSDFSRYLRSFGYSVLALEPKELQDKMLFTYNRIIERYEDSNE